MNKPAWDEQSILDMIEARTQESTSLEYKACDALQKVEARKTEVSKDVSAFANSAGGVLIYGVIEVDNIPVKFDDGFDPLDITREWLEQVINSRIQRRIDGILITPVELKTHNPGRVIYVVEIPQSLRAPHMAFDHRFYKRFNFVATAMEEYEVRDTARRGEAPDLTLNLILHASDQETLPGSVASGALVPSGLFITIENLSANPAEYCLIHVRLDSRLVFAYASTSFQSSTEIASVGDLQIPVTCLTFKWSIRTSMPIWKGAPFSLMNEPVRFGIPSSQVEYYVCWEIHSPRMEPKTEMFSLVFLNGMWALQPLGQKL